MLQCFVVCCSVLARHHLVAAEVGICWSVLQCVAVCCLDVTLLQKKTSIHAYIVWYASWYVYMCIYTYNVEPTLYGTHIHIYICVGVYVVLHMCICVYTPTHVYVWSAHVYRKVLARRHCVAADLTSVCCGRDRCMLQCVAVCSSVLQYFAVCSSVLQCAPVCCSVLARHHPVAAAIVNTFVRVVKGVW